MALPGGEIKLCKRPFRKKVRVFTDKDVARIAKYAVGDGANPMALLASVIVALGLGVLVCKAARGYVAVMSVSNALANIGGVLAVSALIQRAITLLSRNIVLKLPLLNRVTILVISVLAAVDAIINPIGEVIQDLEGLGDVAEFLNNLCELIDSLEG
jgi:hypothetical protein